LIARDADGRAVGLMHCRQMPSPLRGAVVGFLDDLFVEPDVRGQGVVDVLYEALNTLGKQQGWPFIRWITAEDNYRGRAVYDRLSEKTHWITYQKAVE
jgi:GNAT superfamily N-acetyltransferase